MELLNNTGTERLGDILGKVISASAKLSMISLYLIVYTYRELRVEPSKVDEVRFLFSKSIFTERMVDEKDPREFEMARRKREMGIGGSGPELKLRSSLSQRAPTHECIEWIRSKGVFKSVKRLGAIQPRGTYAIENPSSKSHAFNGAATGSTQEGLSYE